MGAQAAATTAQPYHDSTTLDVDDADSTLGTSSVSDWTSVTSSLYKSVLEHGRRYQSFKEGEYCIPVDEQQNESIANDHLAALLHDQNEKTSSFVALSTWKKD